MDKGIHIVTATACFLLWSASPVNGNDKLLIYNAYVMNDMPAWESVINRLQQQKNKNGELLLSLVNYQFGYIGWCIGADHRNEAQKYIALARENLKLLEGNNNYLSMVYAYESALLGYEIGLNVFRAPFIGTKSKNYAVYARDIDPANYFAWLQLGNIQHFMPSVFGGSEEEAVRYFLKAKALMERDRAALRNDWNYLHLLTLIAQAYADLKDYRSARLYCEAILKIEPRCQWIKDNLYPSVLQNFRDP